MLPLVHLQGIILEELIQDRGQQFVESPETTSKFLLGSTAQFCRQNYRSKAIHHALTSFLRKVGPTLAHTKCAIRRSWLSRPDIRTIPKNETYPQIRARAATRHCEVMPIERCAKSKTTAIEIWAAGTSLK